MQRDQRQTGEARDRELEVLNAVAMALNASSDVREALEQTLTLLGDLLGLDTGWVWLLNNETQQFYLAAARNLPPFLQEPVRMSDKWCLCTDLFRHKGLTASNIDVLNCSRLQEALFGQAAEQTRGLHSHASIPLYFQERPLGIINIAGPSQRSLKDEELRLLATISYQVGIAVERARLADESMRLARVEERTRIAREIHDTLAQDLTAIGLDVEGALRHIEDNPGLARERLTRALATTRGSLEEARRSVLDLREGPPAGRPLSEAIAALGRAFTSDTGVPVRLHSAQAEALPLRYEAELYRITQEALNNVRKHAHATAVDVDLLITGDDVVLKVRDDGAGFDAAIKAGAGQGLRGMRERVKLLGGRLRLTSHPGRGTEIAVRVPLPLEVGT